MKKLRDSCGYPTVKRAMRYTAIRLHSRPETAALAQDVDARRTALDRANEAHDQAVDERVAATAVILYLDSIVDQNVMAIARDVAVMTANKTDSELYRPLFPVAPSTAVAPVASDSQNLFVKALIDRIESDSRYESLRGRAQTLKSAQAELEKALAHRTELMTPEARTAADLQAALESARRTYNKLGPHLALIFESKAYIETFFTKLRKPGTADEEETEEETPATEGAETGA